MKTKRYFRFSGPAKAPKESIWEASMITVKTEGNWLIFKDKNRNLLNQPFPQIKTNKKYYKHVPYTVPYFQTRSTENFRKSLDLNSYNHKMEIVSPRLSARKYKSDDEAEQKIPPHTASIKPPTKILDDQMRSPRISSARRSPRRIHKNQNKDKE